MKWCKMDQWIIDSKMDRNLCEQGCMVLNTRWLKGLASGATDEGFEIGVKFKVRSLIF